MTTRKQYWFILIFICLSVIASGQKPTTSEVELQKRADKLYTSGNFAEAAPVYSQLLSLFPHDVLYNYRYGSSLVEAGKEKTPAIVYLEFATKNSLVPEEAWWYLGKAYMQKSNFSGASSAFEKFKSIANPSKAKKLEVELLIANCKNAIEVSKNRKDIAILSSRAIKRAGFYTSYDFSETSGKLVPAADQFLSSLDKSKTKNPLMFISKDGQNIYYSSYGKGSNAGKDIYQIRKMVNGQWGLPENLGPILNSVEDEEYPYLDRDGKTLYFSSRGHTSMGGYDLFKSVFNYNTGQWSVPENMGVPINTASDEFFFVPTLTGEQASYSTNFESNPDEVTFRTISLAGVNNRFAIISGTYFSLDQATRRDARISVVRASDNAVVNSVRTDPKSGKYELVLPPGNDYTLIVEGGGYVTHAEEFSLPDLAVAGMRQEVKLNKDKEREQMTVSNFFTPVSIKENEKVLAFKNTPTNVSTSSILNAGEDSTNLIPVRLNDEIVYIKDPKLNKSENETLIPGKAVNVATYGYTEDRKSNNYEVEVEDIAAKKGLPTISLEEKDRYDPTLEAKMDSDELRQIEEEKERAQIIEEEEKNPTVLIDFNIDNDELAQIALDDAESLQEEAERMKERAQSIKANAVLSDSLSLSLTDEAESLPKSEADKKAELKSRATELKEESLLLNRQASDLLLQASIKMDESRSARKDADAILVSSGRSPSMASNTSTSSTNTKTGSESTTVSRREEFSAGNANFAPTTEENHTDALNVAASNTELTGKIEPESTQNSELKEQTPNSESISEENSIVSQETAESVKQNKELESNSEKITANTSEENIAAKVKSSPAGTQSKSSDEIPPDSRGTGSTSSKIGSAVNVDQFSENEPMQSTSEANVSSNESANTENKNSIESNSSQIQTGSVAKNEKSSQPESAAHDANKVQLSPSSKEASTNELAQGNEQSDTKSGMDSQTDLSNTNALNTSASENEENSGAENRDGLKDISLNNENAVSRQADHDIKSEATLALDNNSQKKQGDIVSSVDDSGSEEGESKTAHSSATENQEVLANKKVDETEKTDDSGNNSTSRPISNSESIAAARENLKKNLSATDYPASNNNVSDIPEPKIAAEEKLKTSNSNNSTENIVLESSTANPQNPAGSSTESLNLPEPDAQSKTNTHSLDEEVKSANNLVSEQQVAVNSSRSKAVGQENVTKTEAKVAQTSAAAVPIREKYSLAEEERSRIDPEAKIVYESYENNLKISEKLFVQSRSLQDRVLAMPKSPERDSLLQVSNALSRESGSQYNLAQSQLEDAMQMDTSLSEKLEYTKAPVIIPGSSLADNNQQNKSSDQTFSASSNESNAKLSSNELAAENQVEPSSPSNEKEISQSTDSRPDPEVLNSKIAVVPQARANSPVKSSVANPSEPLRRAGEENSVQTQAAEESGETSDQNPGSLSINESPTTEFKEAVAINTASSVPSTNSSTETKASTKKTFATAPVISKAEQIEIATREGLDVNHPKYPAYEKAQENVTKEQVNTINLFAEGVNLNKVSVEEKQQQVDLLDSAQKISDESLRNDLLQQAELLGQSSERNQVLSKEKFSASQQKTSEVKSLSSEMESLKAEIKMDPSGTSIYPSADIGKEADELNSGQTGANPQSLKEKTAKIKTAAAEENTTVASAESRTNNNDVSITEENETYSAVSAKELETMAIKMYSKRGGPAYSELNPIPLNPGLPEGLVFKVQVGAFRKPIPDNSFKNLQPVTAETTRPGWLRYCVGLFKTFEPANLVKKELRGTGYKDAFVVAYLDGNRISLQEANALLNRQDNQMAYNGEMKKEIAILQQLNVIPTASMSAVKDNDEELFYGNSPKPITVIEQAIGELEYSVQVGVYRTANPPVILNSLEPIYTEALSKGLYRFTSGRYPERADAETAKDRAIGVGISDAFVVAVRGTKSVALPSLTRNTVNPPKEAPFIASTEPVKSEVSPDIKTSSVPQTGLRFKVQLGAFKQNVPFETVETFLKISDKGIVRVTDDRGLNIFYAGDFDNIESARLLREEVVGKGVTDAFVVVLSNGKRIPLSSVLPKEE